VESCAQSPPEDQIHNCYNCNLFLVGDLIAICRESENSIHHLNPNPKTHPERRVPRDVAPRIHLLQQPVDVIGAPDPQGPMPSGGVGGAGGCYGDRLGVGGGGWVEGVGGVGVEGDFASDH